ncbi:hypothetical protein [Streptomyces sp. TLI_171]|nr:hypothetical protein [Streptomyces sp. TLI_171]RKE22998.1 hypothetical protein BX266_6454 [Streptomyces sp. TLI_171]
MMLLLLLGLVVLVAVAAVEVANGPSGRHRGARRLAPVDRIHHHAPRHRR